MTLSKRSQLVWCRDIMYYNSLHNATKHINILNDGTQQHNDTQQTDIQHTMLCIVTLRHSA
jgi:hypothetical protein